MTRTMSVNDQSFGVTPAAIAGVIRRTPIPANPLTDASLPETPKITTLLPFTP